MSADTAPSAAGEQPRSEQAKGEQPKSEQPKSEQLYAVLIAIAGDILLLPNLSVAEVLGADAVQKVEGRPDWFAGYAEWNGRSVPVIRFERLNRRSVPVDRRRERIVVINSPGRYLPSGHFAVVAQAYPHLTMLTRAAMQAQPLRSDDRDELVLARARVASQDVLIPDLERIEAEIARQQTA